MVVAGPVVDAFGLTAFTPFWCRVQDAGADRPLLGDLAAASLAPQVARRFGRVKVSEATRVGCCLRNRQVDRWLTELVAERQISTVVDLGVGLDTRLRRLPGVVGRYVEVDSGPVIAMRDEWMPATGAVRVTADAMNIAEWIAAVDGRAGAVAVVLEGVLAYQEPAAVAEFWRNLAVCLPEAYVLFDSLSPLSAWLANRPTARRGGRPPYAWSTWHTGRLVARPQRWRVLQEYGLMDFPREQTASFPRADRVLYSLPTLRRAYRLTLAQLPGQG